MHYTILSGEAALAAASAAAVVIASHFLLPPLLAPAPGRAAYTLGGATPILLAAVGLGVLAVLIAASMSVALLPHAEAAVDPGSRDRLDALRDRQRDLQNRHDEIQTRLPALAAEIEAGERKVDKRKERWRDARQEAGTRWDALGKVPDAAAAIEDARAEVRALYVERGQLIAERSRVAYSLQEAKNDAWLLAREIKKNSTSVADSQIVSVVLSDTCRAHVAAVAFSGRGSVHCPTYASLSDLDQSVEGTGPLAWDWAAADLSRQPSNYSDVAALYDNRTSEAMIILDPPGPVQKRTKVVWVEATLPAMVSIPPPRIEFGHNATAPNVQFAPWLHTRVAHPYCTHVILGAAEAAEYGVRAAILDSVEFLRDGCRANSGPGRLNMTVTDAHPVWQPPYRHTDSPEWQRHLYWEGRADSCHDSYGQCRNDIPSHYGAVSPPPPVGGRR